jgi:hypothetical protein
MDGELVLGITGVIVGHKPIPCDLGYDRRRGNEVAGGVAVYNRALREQHAGKGHGVNQHGVGLDIETADGLFHGLYSRPVDVDPVDVSDVDDAETDRGGAPDNLIIETLPLLRRDRL